MLYIEFVASVCT